MKAPKLSFPSNQSLLLGPNLLKDENIYLVRKSIDDPPRIFYKENKGKQEKLSLDLSKASKFKFNWVATHTPSLKRENSPSTEIPLTDLEGLTRNQRKRLRRKYKKLAKQQITPLNFIFPKKKDTSLSLVEPDSNCGLVEKHINLQRAFHLSDSENSALEQSLSPEKKKSFDGSTSFAPDSVNGSELVVNNAVFFKKDSSLNKSELDENPELASAFGLENLKTEIAGDSLKKDVVNGKKDPKLESSPILSNISNSASGNPSGNSSNDPSLHASPIIETNLTIYNPLKDQQPSPNSDLSNAPSESGDKPVKYVPTPICKVLPINLPTDCYNSSALFLYDDNLVSPMNALFDPKNFKPKFNSNVTGPLHGFRNMGATCFMNASLQCLFNCPIFSNYLIDTYCEEKAKIADLFPLGRLRFLAHRLIVEGKKVIPRSIEKNLTKLHPFLERGYQHDAEEFLTALLGKLVDMSAKELKELAGSNYHPCQINSDPFTQMFGITSRTTLSCPCGHKNYTQVQSLLLSLPVTPTLEESIKQLSKPELLEDYSCPSCKKKGGVRKSDAIRVPPQILIIRLSRSCYDENGAYKDKSLVKYNSVLDLAPYLINGSSKSLEYELCGIVLHEGSSVQSGHYVAQVLSPDKVWRQYDDEIYCKIPSPTLQSRQAYVLVYTRKEVLDYKSEIPAVVIQDSDFIPQPH